MKSKRGPHTEQEHKIERMKERKNQGLSMRELAHEFEMSKSHAHRLVGDSKLIEGDNHSC